MKKKNCLLAGTAVALMVCLAAGSASASVGKVTRELEYRDIQVTLNGEKLDLRNAVGDPVEPFMFGGTNYLPVRALAEALGLDVSWDGANATVVLQDPDAGEDYGTDDSTDYDDDHVRWIPDKGTLGDSEVEILDAELAWDDDGDPALVVTYQWTNRSERRVYAMELVREAAYQDGESLSYTKISDETVYDVDASYKEVRPGTTVRVQSAYALNDTETTVEFELTDRDGLYYEPDAYVFRDFPLEGLEMPPMPELPGGPRESV